MPARPRVLAVLLVAASAVTTGGAAAHADAGRRAPALSVTAPATAPTGGRVVVGARYSGRARGTAVLELRRDGRWVAQARARQGRRGARVRLVAPAGPIATRLTFRVRVLAGGRTRATRTVRVRVTAPPAPAPARPSAPPAPPAPPAASSAPGRPGGNIPSRPSNEAATSFVAVYAVAADQQPEPGHAEAIATTVDRVGDWFATQTAGEVRPRWVRAEGEGRPVAVEVVRLPRTAEAYAGAGLDALRDDVLAAFPRAGEQVAVVWTRTGSPEGCGVTGRAPTMVWLPELACDIAPTTTHAWPYGGTYLLGHELTHAFGAAEPCVLHQDGSGHVTDDPRDVIYGGPGQRDWRNLMLDPGRDDYYGTGRCGDIAGSALWTRPGER